MDDGSSSSERSVFLGALGDEATRLRPEVHQYLTATGAGVSVCDGVFDVAGSRFRWLGLIMRPLVGPDLLVSRFERSVPFRVVNRPSIALDGTVELRASRSFRFARGSQGFADVLRWEGEGGVLRNVLGRAGRLELRLRCDVTDAGHLRLRSERTWLRLGALRIRLLGPLGVRAELMNGFDDSTGRQTVSALVRNVLLGTVLEYRGSFDIHDAPDDGTESAGGA